MKKIISILLLTMLFTSCSCLKKSIDSNGIILNESNLTLLNGKYERKLEQLNENSSSIGDLDWIFFSNSYSNIFKEDKGLNLNSNTDFFELKVIDKNKILVSYIDGNDTIRSKIRKGKIKNGYFEFKRKHLFLPFILTNFYRDSKFRIKLSHNGDLVTDYNQISFGTVYFIIPFYDKEKEYNLIFKRVDDIVE